MEMIQLKDAVTKGSSNISLNKIKDDKGTYPLFSAKGFYKNISFYHQEEEYLAIIKDGAGIGRISIHPPKSSCVGTMQYLIPKKGFDIRFIRYCLLSIDFTKYSQGATIPHIYFKDYKSELLPKLSFEEQLELVSKLDQAFEVIDQAIANTEKNIKNVDELFKSSINSLLTEESPNNIQSNLRDLTTKIGSGATPKGGKSSYKVEGISLIRSMNVHDLQFKMKDLAFIDDNQAGKLNNVTLEADDVLLNITGASIARTCIVPAEVLPARVNQHVSIIRAKKDQIRPQLLNFILYSEKYKKEILGIGEKGATRQAITKGQLESLTVKFPNSLNKQDLLIEKANCLHEKTRMLTNLFNKKLNNLFELKMSILERAFKGELV